jgi:hypothetical protein
MEPPADSAPPKLTCHGEGVRVAEASTILSRATNSPMEGPGDCLWTSRLAE